MALLPCAWVAKVQHHADLTMLARLSQSWRRRSSCRHAFVEHGPIGAGATAAYAIIIANQITFTGGATFHADFSSLLDGSPNKAVALAE